MSTATTTPAVPSFRTRAPSGYERLLAAGLLPDVLVRLGIRRLLRRRLRGQDRGSAAANERALDEWVGVLRESPITIEADAANAQHYELPPEFFVRVLGRRLKYSCCLWERGARTLDEAEDAMLALTAERALLADGQDVLELGCGWGSLTLWMGERYPRSRILAVSNSASQRAFVEARAAERGLLNVEVVTRDVRDFSTDRRFDRVVTVEMLEHVRNYETLLARVAGWMREDARLFVHVFAHRAFAYPFEPAGEDDWMARYFFTGGQMPSEDLLPRFERDVVLEERWRVSGREYERTANAWLARLDRSREALRPVLEATYGRADATRWLHYWRVFFMACAELWGFGGGAEWGVAHYRFARR